MRTFGYTFLLLVAVGAVFLLWPGLISSPSQGIRPAVCPHDLKTCPNGSTVGRTGSGCTFAECAATTTLAQLSTTTTSTSTIATASEDVTFAVGESKQVRGVFFHLTTVMEDSRCPASVQCIQAGSVTAQLIVGRGAGQQSGTVSSDQPPVRFGRESVLLAAVMPSRASTTTIPQTEYRLTFRFEHL